MTVTNAVVLAGGFTPRAYKDAVTVTRAGVSYRADDASKLLALTTELKSDVDKTDKDELSLEVMRKAAEIEKLAHDVQSRMKN